MLWFFSLAWNCSPEYWDDNICKFSCLSLYYPTPRMTDTSPSSQFAIFIFVFVFLFVYNHLVILLTPVHRRGWESPKTRMMGDWSHLLISQWLIFVFFSFSPFLLGFCAFVNAECANYSSIKPSFRKYIQTFNFVGVFDVSDTNYLSTEGKLARYWPENH